jgi:LuxR family maltose regulon positive regulatory protein
VSAPLLSTKLIIPPLRSSLILRQILIDKLNAGLQSDGGLESRSLTLVSAPAGYGKTTLISSWLYQLDQPSAWLSLDEDDNDINRFIFYVITALQKVHSELGATTLSLLQTPQPPAAQTLITLLINDLTAWQKKVVLVLDDYHVIQELAIHETIEFLLNNQPPQLHLVIISREDPALPLHRLRSNGRMTGLYAHDLRFTSNEAARFLNQTMGLSLSPDQVTTLERRTEGWVAGLQLAALSMQDLPDTRGFVTSFAGDDRYISDYLLGEIIERQPETVQDFLMRTAILDRFCAPLCEAIIRTGDQDLEIGDQDQLGSSQAIIDHLDQSNLFIVPLDNKREWYRYHHLFANFLRIQVRALSEEQISKLHWRASEWFENNGYPAKAVEHALAAKDYERAAQLIEQTAMATLWGYTQWTTLLDWIDALPTELVRSRKQLSLQYAWALFTMGRWEAVDPYLSAVEAATTFENADPNKLLLGEVVTLRAWLAFEIDDMALCVDLAERALELLPEEALTIRSLAILAQGAAQFWLGNLQKSRQALQEAINTGLAGGNVAVALAAMGCQVQTEVMLGYLRKASEIYNKARQLGTIDGVVLLSPTGYACVQMGEVLREWNQLQEAEILLKEGIQLCRQAGIPEYVLEGQMTLSRVLLAAGDESSAAEIMTQAERDLREWLNLGGNIQFVITPALTHRAHYWLATGDIIKASHWLEENGIQINGDIDPGTEIKYLLLTRTLIAEERFSEAVLLLKRLLTQIDSGERLRSIVEALVLMSIAARANGERDLEYQSLKRALQLAEPEGYRRIFIDEGRRLTDILEEAQDSSEVADYAKVLQNAIQEESRRSIEMKLGELDKKTKAAPTRTTHELMETLSEREITILRLMAANLSHREIAEELYLSVNTIKWHSTNIYGKLGVNKRANAIACAQEMGII